MTEGWRGRTRNLTLVHAGILAFGLMLLVQGLHHDSGEAVSTRRPGKGPDAAARRAETPVLASSTTLPDPQERSDLPGPVSGRLERDESDYQLWRFNSQDLNWLLANQRLVLTRELETRPEPTGGLRVLDLRGASFAVLKGLKPGDVLIDINGKELDTPFDVEDLLEDPAYQAAKGWRVRILREDTVVTLDYRAN